MRANDFTFGERLTLPGRTTRSARQNGSRADRWSARAAMGVAYAPIPWLMRLLVAIHFRRLRVRHMERLPARGPVLLVANHPATWMDAVVLIAALGRKPHFLAHEALFQPRPRAWILRLFGALPVVRRSDPPGAIASNTDTFRRCGTLLARGEVVAIFPEGVSAGDRSVEPLRTGAARIALERLAGGGPLEVIPVGIHYADRTAFRSDVVVSVGPALPLKTPPATAVRDEWIAELTTRMRAAIARQIVDLPEPSLRWLAEQLVPPDHSADSGVFERMRRVARRLARYRRRSPAGFADCRRHALRRCGLAGRLQVAPADLGRGSDAALGPILVITSLPALTGLVLNAPPAAFTAVIASRFPEPHRVGLARIVASMFGFTGWYAAAVIFVTWMNASVWLGLLAVLAAAALGMCTLLWGDAWPRARGSIWIPLLERLRPGPLSRLRREQEALRSFTEQLARAPRLSRAGSVPGGAA